MVEEGYIHPDAKKVELTVFKNSDEWQWFFLSVNFVNGVKIDRFTYPTNAGIIAQKLNYIIRDGADFAAAFRKHDDSGIIVLVATCERKDVNTTHCAKYLKWLLEAPFLTQAELERTCDD
jgi:hypothetical protein